MSQSCFDLMGRVRLPLRSRSPSFETGRFAVAGVQVWHDMPTVLLHNVKNESGSEENQLQAQAQMVFQPKNRYFFVDPKKFRFSFHWNSFIKSDINLVSAKLTN